MMDWISLHGESDFLGYPKNTPKYFALTRDMFVKSSRLRGARFFRRHVELRHVLDLLALRALFDDRRPFDMALKPF